MGVWYTILGVWGILPPMGGAQPSSKEGGKLIMSLLTGGIKNIEKLWLGLGTERKNIGMQMETFCHYIIYFFKTHSFYY